jgi:hypothetical protein
MPGTNGIKCAPNVGEMIRSISPVPKSSVELPTRPTRDLGNRITPNCPWNRRYSRERTQLVKITRCGYKTFSLSCAVGGGARWSKFEGGDSPKLVWAGGDPEWVELEYEPFTVTGGELVRSGTETAAATARTGVVKASS